MSGSIHTLEGRPSRSIRRNGGSGDMIDNVNVCERATILDVEINRVDGLMPTNKRALLMMDSDDGDERR